jgi:glucuronate isomerase
MSSFLTKNFLLETDAARRLYHDYAAPQPIIDYHNHLPPSDIANNRNFENLTRIWLDGDHYKWRAMRTLGINEKYITGDASDREKFMKWAETVPYTVRNPLYHWTHMELKKYFGIDELLDTDSAGEIYDQCSEKLQESSFSTRSLLKKMNVETLCTTDDPADSLEFHKLLQDDFFEIDVLPAFRPDKAYAFDDPASYNSYLEKLEEASGSSISTFDGLLETLEKRIDYFHDHGCRLSDHGLAKIPPATSASKNELDKAFDRLRSGGEIERPQKDALSYAILLELGRMYDSRDWVQQYHLGALRDTNRRMKRELGADAGLDSIGDFQQASTLARILDELDSTDQLAKTILYNVNPSDNEVMASMTGNFSSGGAKGKMQYGSAWWFMDQKDGMERQLNTLSNLGLLSCFVGMLTDSRSFLSYPRHEYFRRILCNLFGNDVDNGELPKDLPWLGKIVSDICYNNAKEYFNF